MKEFDFKGIVYSISNRNTKFYQNSLRKLKCEVVTVSSYEEFNQHIKTNLFDLILLDLKLEIMDGISILKDIRNNQKKTREVIFICSNSSYEFLIIDAFDSGADSFISLPISSTIFQFKIYSYLKRIKKKNVTLPYFVVDEEKFKVTINSKDYSLQRKDFHILNLLHSVPGKKFSRQEIALKVWNNESILKGRLIEVHINRIRRILGGNVILTYHRTGYGINTNFLG